MAENDKTEAPVKEKAPKEPVNKQVPAQYKNAETGKYLPGLDARHASDVAKRIVAGEDEQKALAELGSDKLRAKALNQVESQRVKIANTGVAGFVNVRGEEFEARRLRGGKVRYDGPKGWVEVEADDKIAKTFESLKDREAEIASVQEG